MEHVILGAVLAIAGVLMAAAGTISVRTAYRRKHYWAKAYGKILSSDLVHTNEGGEGVPRYKSNVSYGYEVAGAQYRGSESYVNGLAKEMFRKYPNGRKVMIYYNPENVSQSRLEPGLIDNTILMSIAGIGMLIIGLVILIVGLNK